MKKYQKTITVYELGGGFVVEVSKQDKWTEFYLHHEKYSVKHLMFGLPDFDEANEEEMILSNADEHIRFYKEQYFD